MKKLFNLFTSVVLVTMAFAAGFCFAVAYVLTLALGLYAGWGQEKSTVKGEV